MSEQRAIVEMVSEAKPGAVFVPSDFAEAGYTMKETSDDDDLSASDYEDDGDSGEDDFFGGEDD